MVFFIKTVLCLLDTKNKKFYGGGDLKGKIINLSHLCIYYAFDIEGYIASKSLFSKKMKIIFPD